MKFPNSLQMEILHLFFMMVQF